LRASTTYGFALSSYVGAAILFTYFRFAQWFDAVRILSVAQIPFYFSYGEGIARGGLLGILVASCIFLIFRKLDNSANCNPVRSALWVFVSYFTFASMIIVTQPLAYDPGLILDLMILGFTAVVSTWLYAGDVELKRQPKISNANTMLKWVELGHRETVDAITSLTLVVIAGFAALGYNFLHTGITVPPGPPSQTLIAFSYYTCTLGILDYGMIVIGFTFFTMAPLFIRLDIYKAALKERRKRPF
jgi:hypothetical protein